MYPLPSYRHTDSSNNNNDLSYSKERKQDATELYLKRATELHSIRDDNGVGIISQDTENEYNLNSNKRSLTHSLTHTLTYSHTHLLTHSLTHSLTYSLTHSLTKGHN